MFLSISSVSRRALMKDETVDFAVNVNEAMIDSHRDRQSDRVKVNANAIEAKDKVDCPLPECSSDAIYKNFSFRRRAPKSWSKLLHR